MGKASSAKKVARAARAGQTASSSERRELGFPITIAVILVLGVLLVGWARTQRDASAAPTISDHWHSAYGVYDCTTGGFQDPILDESDADGIHTHGDGLIHIHPFNSSATGDNATMGVFLDVIGASITEDAITFPDRDPLEAGVECDGEEAIIQVLRFDADNTDISPEVITSDFDDIKFRKNREAFTIALAPEGADLPLPPTVGVSLDTVSPTDLVPGETYDPETGEVSRIDEDEADPEGADAGDAETENPEDAADGGGVTDTPTTDATTSGSEDEGDTGSN